MSVCCELSSGPVVQLTMGNKYLGKRNISLVYLTEQEPRLYDKCNTDYSRRDKTDPSVVQNCAGNKVER
jgi:hypothetical protein